MNRRRVIPVLTIENDKLVKTVKFKKPNYIGDPVNAVKIFNEKEVDEIVLLDISATKNRQEPNYEKIEEICSEAFMPFAYGGGIKTLDQIDKIFGLGIEKVILNSVLNEDIKLVQKATEIYGEQSIVASLDVKKSKFGKYSFYTHSGKKRVREGFDIYLKKVLDSGVGEVILTSINKDGTFDGYDLQLIKRISAIAEVPLVANGGASDLNSLKEALVHGASATAAGSFFVYRGKTKGILISYPTQDDLINQVFTD